MVKVLGYAGDVIMCGGSGNVWEMVVCVGDGAVDVWSVDVGWCAARCMDEI